MTDLTSVSIPKPKDWQAFERHSRLLIEKSLGDQAVQNNGRPGQRQHGVDIFGKRGGTGPQVGVQCKGKQEDYGKAVTKTELKLEVEKTNAFVPALDEFILITTAPDDAVIQQAARLLEQDLKSNGRNLAIQVWGWGRIEQEINRFPEAIREFHPDATPFTGEILDGVASTNRLVTESATVLSAQISTFERRVLQALEVRPPQMAPDPASAPNALDKEWNSQIDGYRELLRGDQPRTAIKLLHVLKERIWADASPRIKYRILSNIGAAHYNLGEYELASDYLLEAAPLDPDDPRSVANKAAALLLKGRKDEARTVAIDGLAKHPDNQEIALQRLQALSAGETLDEVWDALPEFVKTNAVAHGHRVFVLREAGDPRWPALLKEAAERFPDDLPLKTFAADSVIDRLLSADAGAVGKDGPAVPTPKELTDAVTILIERWKASLSGERGPSFGNAHNAAVALNILGETAAAAELLDATFARGYDSEQTKRLRISLYRRQGNVANAIKMADALPDSSVSRIIRADLRADNAPKEAREILANRAFFTRDLDILAVAQTVIEAYLSENDYVEAEREAERLCGSLPKHPQAALALFRVKSARGDQDAGTALDQALALVNPDTDFPTRFLIGDALVSVQRFQDIPDLLLGFTSLNYDSPALRLLLAASINADLRVTVRQLLAAMPAEVSTKLYYQKIKIALDVRTGDMAAAEKSIRQFLEREPTNLEMHLQLLNAQFRRDDMKQLKAAVAAPATDLKGSPEDFLRLAQFKDSFGDWREAHALAYRTLLGNMNNPAVHLGYVGVFIRPGHSTELEISPPQVEAESAVSLRVDDASELVFVVEPNPALRPTGQYVAPDHAVAKLLLGQKVGAQITLPSGQIGKIRWIRPKVLHALHTVMEGFNNQFPEATGMRSVRINTKKPGGAEPILQQVRERHDAIVEVEKLYTSGALPLRLVGQALGCDPAEALIGLISHNIAIRSCDGSTFERDAAFAAIDANAATGCVVDTATLHIIRRLKLERAVSVICGPIGVIHEVEMGVRQRVQNLGERPNETDTSLSYRDGQYYRDEVTPTQKKEIIRALEMDLQWLAEHTIVLPAEGTQDPGTAWRPLLQRFGTSFLDDVRAAQGSSRLFLCEDHLLRALAQLDFQVPGTWLQPVLMKAHEKGVITQVEYQDALLGLISCNIEFLSISTDALVFSLQGTVGHEPPAAFKKLASRIGGQKADLPSHCEVATNTVFRVWNVKTFSSTLQQAVAGLLLNNLIQFRSKDEIRDVVATWVTRDPARGRRGSLSEYIRNWLVGHFIDLK